MKNKVSLIALLLTLTACGGGNSPVSTLPEIAPTNPSSSDTMAKIKSVCGSGK